MKRIPFLFLLVLNMKVEAQLLNQSTLNGPWIFSSSSEKQMKPIPENQIPKLIFDEENKTATGFTGCNNFKATYACEDENFAFINLISTQKACDNMQVELFIRPFLTQVGYYKIEQDKLYLVNKSDKNRFVVYTRVAGLNSNGYTK
jgi:heat shock protein HslJ